MWKLSYCLCVDGCGILLQLRLHVSNYWPWSPILFRSSGMKHTFPYCLHPLSFTWCTVMFSKSSTTGLLFLFRRRLLPIVYPVPKFADAVEFSKCIYKCSFHAFLSKKKYWCVGRISSNCVRCLAIVHITGISVKYWIDRSVKALVIKHRDRMSTVHSQFWIGVLSWISQGFWLGDDYSATQQCFEIYWVHVKERQSADREKPFDELVYI